jgi:hypothetical protein
MQKMTLALTIAATFALVGPAQAEDTTAQTMATWSATAVKDTTSKLTVTPVGNLYFQYSAGSKGFSSQQGLFDVTVEGGEAITDFKLTSTLVTNTLTQVGPSGSTLQVGVNYHGAPVSKSAETVLIDTSSHTLGYGLKSLANAGKQPGRTSAQDQFDFSIISATADGTKAVTDYSALPEGTWTGDVNVRFDVVWTS